MLTSALHKFRPARAPRTRFRPQCRPATAALSHWLKHAKPSKTNLPAPYPPPLYPLGPSQIPPEMRDIVTNNPGGFPHPPLDWDGPRPEVWRMEMSYIEAAALHDLPVRYPEAYEWLIAEARKHVRPKWQGRPL